MKNLFYTLSLIIGLTLFSTAQNCDDFIINQIPASLNVSSCSSGILRYEIKNNSSSIPTSVTINLPSGIQYVSLNTGSTVAFTSGTATNPVFTPIASWNLGSTIIIDIIVFATCNSSGVSISGSSTINIDGVTSSCNTTEFSIINLNETSISVTNITGSSPILKNVGDLDVLKFRVKNNSSAGIIEAINIDLDPDNTIQLLSYCIVSVATPSCSSTSPIPTSPTPLVVSTDDFSSIGNLDNFLNPGEEFDIIIAYQVKPCQAVDKDGVYKFYIGCQGQLPLCDPFPLTTDINIVTGLPKLTVTQLNTSDIVNSSYTSTTSATLGFIYTNTGTPVAGAPFGNARLVDLKLYLYSTTTFTTIDPNTIKVDGVLVPISIISGPFIQGAFTYFIIDFNLLTVPLSPTSPIQDYDGDAQVDDMNEGDSFKLLANVTYFNGNTNCPADFATCQKDVQRMALVTQLRFNDQCRSLVGLNHTQPFSVTNTGNGRSFYRVESGNSTLGIPQDVEEGSPIDLDICPDVKQQWGVGVAGIGSNYLLDCPNGKHQVRVILPEGYHLVGTTPITFPVTISYAVSCGSGSQIINATATETVVPGIGNDYIIIEFSTGLLPTVICTQTLTYNIDCFKLPLELICNGNVNVPLGGQDDFSYTVEYVCDPNVTCYDVLTCANSSTFHHCIGDCNSFFQTLKPFKFERASLGWKNIPLSSEYNCNNVTFSSTESENVLPENTRINAAYPADEIVATVNGFFSGNPTEFSTMQLQLRYDAFATTDVANPEIFDLISANVVVSGSNDNGLTPIAIPGIDGSYTMIPLPTTGTSGVIELNYTISPADMLLIQNAFNNDPNSPTSLHMNFEAEVHLRVKSFPSLPLIKSFFSYGTHPVQNLRAEFKGLRGANLEPSCDHWGANFEILQPEVKVFIAPAPVNTKCTQTQVGFQLGQINPIHQIDDYPNEFRAFTLFDEQLQIQIPLGYDVVNVEYRVLRSPGNSYRTYPINLAQPLSSNLTGTLIEINGLNGIGQCWPYMDAITASLANYSEIRVTLQPNCEAPSTGVIEFTGGYTENIQGPPSHQVHTSFTPVTQSRIINYNPPVLSITAPPTVNAITNEAIFQFSYCNSSPTSAAPEGWVAFENTNNALDFSAANHGVCLTSVPGVLLPWVLYNNGTTNGLMVFVGNIPASQCVNMELKVGINQNGCTPNTIVADKINVKFGYECTPPAVQLTSPYDGSCLLDSVEFNFNRFPGSINLTPTFSTEVVNLCGGQLIYNFIIDNPELGNVTNPTFTTNLPAGVTVSAAIFTHPSQGSTSYLPATSPSVNINTWDLKTVFPALMTTGLLGASAPIGQNQIIIQLVLDFDCDYNGDPIQFYAGGISPCSQVLQTAPLFHIPNFNNTCCNPCVVNAGLDATICQGDVFEITPTGGTSYTITPGSISGPPFNVSPSVTTTYTVTGTIGDCSNTDEITITVSPIPIADAPSNVTTCDSYTLPTLTVGNYYTGVGGTGTALFAGNLITSTQTIYVYAETGTIPNCTDENSFTVTINPTLVADAPSNVTTCDSYTLPTLTVGNYYTGAGGTGTALFAGDNITTTQTIYVYAETGTTPNCTDENSFVVTVNPTPEADAPTDVIVCDSYELPVLAVGNYYTGVGGTGTALFAGDNITTTQTIYVYAETGTTPNCTDENSFVVTINCNPCTINPVFSFNGPFKKCLDYKFLSNLTTFGTGTTPINGLWTITEILTGSVIYLPITNIASANPNFSFPANGTYEVCLTINAIGAQNDTCSATTCQLIEVECPPCIITSAFIIEPPKKKSSCLDFIFNATSTISGFGTSITDYQWTITDIGTGILLNTITSTNPILNYQFPVNGNYNVCLTVSGIGLGGDLCSSTICNIINVTCSPCTITPAFIFEKPKKALCSDFIFNATSTTSGFGTSIINYHWTITDMSGNIIFTTTSTNPMLNYQFPINGSFDVCLTVNAVGPGNDTCNAIICEQIKVKCKKEKALERYLVDSPANIISPKIYPNPNTGKFTLEFNQFLNGKIEVIIETITGNELYRIVDNDNNKIEVDMKNNLKKGVYLVRIIYGDYIFTERIVIF